MSGITRLFYLMPNGDFSTVNQVIERYRQAMIASNIMYPSKVNVSAYFSIDGGIQSHIAFDFKRVDATSHQLEEVLTTFFSISGAPEYIHSNTDLEVCDESLKEINHVIQRLGPYEEFLGRKVTYVQDTKHQTI
jgi:hypothetical protein